VLERLVRPNACLGIIASLTVRPDLPGGVSQQPETDLVHTVVGVGQSRDADLQIVFGASVAGQAGVQTMPG
jgi:hypothetical protein